MHNLLLGSQYGHLVAYYHLGDNNDIDLFDKSYYTK